MSVGDADGFHQIQHLLEMAYFFAREACHFAQQPGLINVFIGKAQCRASGFFFAVGMIDEKLGHVVRCSVEPRIRGPRANKIEHTRNIGFTQTDTLKLCS